MRQIKAISFDAAGTLLHAHPSVGHVYAEILGRHGPSVPAEIMEKAFRDAFAERRARNGRSSEPPTGARSALYKEGYDWWRALVFEALGSLGITVREPDRFFYELYWRFAEPDVWRLFPDALPALDAARGLGLKIVLISNWDVRLRRLLERMNVIGRFDSILISTEVAIEKPDPRIFRLACERLGIQPAGLLHVGDHPREDVEGAAAAGVTAVLLDRNAGLDTARMIVNDLRQAVALAAP